MKKVIEDLARKAGLQTAYAGSTRIMYVRGEGVTAWLISIRKLYPKLAFELKDGSNTSEFTTAAKTDLKVAPPEKNVVETVHEKANAFLLDEVGQFDFKEEKKKPTPEEVDAYLLANPVDHKAKGPYNAAAKHFDVKPDYIRGRWARLRELGKVEIETANA